MAALDAIGVVVGDMAAALGFYRMVGLDVPDGADDEQHVEVVLGGGIRLMFDTEDLVKSFNEEWAPPEGVGRISLAVLCADAEAVDEAHRRIVEAGHRSVKAPFDAFWGQRYATVLDPDGNSVDLFAPAG